MMSRPSASSARARTRTLKAPSTPKWSIRAASFMSASRGLAKERNAIAEFYERYTVADLGTFALDAAGKAPAIFQLDDRQLVGNVVDVCLGRRIHNRFGVDGSGAGIRHAAPNMLTTLVAPDPPRFCARPTLLRGIWRSPASPRICSATSQICPTPVAPTGWPLALSPPLVLTGSSPLRQVLPASAYGPPSPFLTKPRSSVARISAIVKQSCTSANWISDGLSPAIL